MIRLDGEPSAMRPDQTISLPSPRTRARLTFSFAYVSFGERAGGHVQSIPIESVGTGPW